MDSHVMDMYLWKVPFGVYRNQRVHESEAHVKEGTQPKCAETKCADIGWWKHIRASAITTMMFDNTMSMAVLVGGDVGRPCW
jgi:hypothetical protein